MQRPGRAVYGPYGLLTVADLPKPGTTRWVIRRKAEIVAAVRGGLLSLELACSRYGLTPEEYLSWRESIDQHGVRALRVTRLQQYRRARIERSVASPSDDSEMNPRPQAAVP
jgi:hypothetical protein